MSTIAIIQARISKLQEILKNTLVEFNEIQAAMAELANEQPPSPKRAVVAAAHVSKPDATIWLPSTIKHSDLGPDQVIYYEYGMRWTLSTLTNVDSNDIRCLLTFKDGELFTCWPLLDKDAFKRQDITSYTLHNMHEVSLRCVELLWEVSPRVALEQLLSFMKLYAQWTRHGNSTIINTPMPFKVEAVRVLHNHMTKSKDNTDHITLWSWFIQELIREHEYKDLYSVTTYVYYDINFLITNFLIAYPKTFVCLQEWLFKDPANLEMVRRTHSRDNYYALQQIAKDKVPYKTYFDSCMKESVPQVAREAFAAAFAVADQPQLYKCMNKLMIDLGSPSSTYSQVYELSTMMLYIDMMTDNVWEKDDLELVMKVFMKYRTERLVKEDKVSALNVVDNWLFKRHTFSKHVQFLKELCKNHINKKLFYDTEYEVYDLGMIFFYNLTGYDHSRECLPDRANGIFSELVNHMRLLWEQPLKCTDALNLLVHNNIRMVCTFTQILTNRKTDKMFELAASCWLEHLFKIFRFHLDYDVNDLTTIWTGFFDTKVVREAFASMHPNLKKQVPRLGEKLIDWCTVSFYGGDPTQTQTAVVPAAAK